MSFHATGEKNRWLSVANLADEPDVGVSEDPREAIRDALVALETGLAYELAATAEPDSDWPDEAG